MAVVSASTVKELRERTGLGMMECKKALSAADGDIDVAIENLRKASGLKAAKKAERTAADGVVTIRLAEDNSYGLILEVNSETDFVARDDGFLAFVDQVAEKALANKETDLSSLMKGELETAREALVQKIGENISVRRVQLLDGPTVGAYVHSNNRIAVLVQLTNGAAELAKDVAMHVAAVNPEVVNSDDMPEEILNKEKEIIKAQPDMENKPAAIVEKMVGGRIKKFLKENSLIEQPFVKNPEISVGQLVEETGAKIQAFVRFEVGEGIELKKVDFAEEVAAQVRSSK
ncbi:MAG: elongation factor Ts [Cellvibrionaceae bacterium]|jgi:elongation factor Ts